LKGGKKMKKSDFVKQLKRGLEYQSPQIGVVSFGFYSKNRYIILYANGKEKLLSLKKAFEFYQKNKNLLIETL
jgi:hypothetical protein